MAKIKSLEELKKIRDDAKNNTQIRTTGESNDRIIVAVGMATCGIAAGARPVMTALLDEIAAHKIDNVSVISTGCLGFCYAEPLVEVRVPGQSPIRYANVNATLAKEIITKHIMQGKFIDNAIFGREVNKSE